MAQKVWIHVDAGDGGPPQRVCWYAGTSDQMVESAIRLHLRLARYSRFLLRDADGDLVPAASTLPHDHTFVLFVVDDVVSTTPMYRAEPARESVASRQQLPRHKRRRVQHDQDVDAAAVADAISASDAAAAFSSDTGYQQPTILARANLPATPLRPRSIVHLVTRFLETFTCAIPNDDNISFIPSTGPYALYALYCHLFKDMAYHPKSQNAFYKMTSFQGKIDRQRVIRYYQCTTSRSSSRTNDNRDNHTNDRDHEEPAHLVVYKPEGKGPLLRKYVKIGTDIAHDELVLAASFVQGLNLNPVAVIDQYTAFLEGFQPVSKAVYQAHTRSRD